MKNSWLIPFSESDSACTRLFCFPYAGGSAQIFRDWPSYLGASVSPVGIQAPGKGSRLLEAPLGSVCEFVDKLLPIVEPLLYETEFAFFGHSNGALIAFELACSLQTRGSPLPRHLFLSANPAPWTRSFERNYSAMSDAEFADVLLELKGTPPEVLQNHEMLQLILPGLRADFSLAEGYQFLHDRKLEVSTTIFYGEEDDIEERQIYAWQDQVVPRIIYRPISAGHFFVHSHASEIARCISEQLGFERKPGKAEISGRWLAATDAVKPTINEAGELS